MAETDYNVINKGPDGGPGNEPDNESGIKLLNKYKRLIDKAESSSNTKKFREWEKAGKKAYKGYSMAEDADPEVVQAVQASEINSKKIFEYEVNFLRKPIESQIARTYARNPKFIAKPTKPIFVDAPPVPQIDPMTGFPVLDQMGNPVMIPQLGEDGLPKQIDVSENVCDVVEAIMEEVFRLSDFKAEAKSCTREAHHSPASIMQIGYQYDDESGIDEIYFRRRRFRDFLIDPDADVYDGVVRRCKWMAVKWKLSRSEAESLGLDWQMVRNKDEDKLGEDVKVCVYQLWHKPDGVVVWVPENGYGLGKEPQPWPWKIKGFPFEILKFTEDTDQQFSKPPIVEALPIQEELRIQREEITANVTNSRPMTIFDPLFIDEDKMNAISKRGKYANIPVEGAASLPGEPIRRIGDRSLSGEFYTHYERNKAELNEVLGTSPNEALRATETTAKEAEIIDRNSGNSTSAKIDIQSDFQNNCSKKAVQIMRQTYTTERVTQIIGRDNTKYWVRWVGAQILQDIEISIETGSTEREDSAYNRQVSLNMLETMKGVPGIDVTMLALDVLRDHGKRNAENYKVQQSPMMPQPQMAGQAPVGVGPTSGNDVAAGITGQMSPMV